MSNANNIAIYNASKKSTGVAILISLLIGGGGNVYAGRTGKGIAVFFAYILAAILALPTCGISAIAVFVYSLVSAYRDTKKYNAKLAASLGVEVE